MNPALPFRVTYREFTELPVWRAAREFKLAIYRLCGSGSLAQRKEPGSQLRAAAASAPALISEAYGRFNPLDSARLLTQAKAELVESQNHLIDACDQQLISDAERLEHHRMAQGVIDQIDGWREYLQSPEAQRKVKEIREGRQRRRTRKGHGGRNENGDPRSQ